MQIDSRLLEKYAAGLCTADEEAAVENWLSTPGDPEARRYAPLFEGRKEYVWQSTVRSLSKGGKSLPFARLRYGTAACLLCALAWCFWPGAFQGPPQGSLKITSGAKVTFVEADTCHLAFSGYLQLVNASTESKFVVCQNGKAFHLEPGETYYLETIREEHYLIPEKYLSPEDDYVRFVRGDVRIINPEV
ncbi:hypothetical protein LAG90_18160 [Marinilongibacter aquaticus]|uniref:hypothetical protein n=1 Tax=Marinilongibacter aquaticus TaxID=2975157 RepID=UPI0021BD034D|nr:hypothetical protein [Marinilongibacter aquaticus]UBM58727.1 hypothetical protein LAG90_18160 [Marinilongibacter aquaticus]